MVQIEIPTFLNELVELGVEPIIQVHPDTGLIFDLQTGMKSHMHLFKTGNLWMVNMRYGQQKEVNSAADLAACGFDCMKGRTYVHGGWINVFEKYDKNRWIQHLEKYAS